MQGIKNEQYTTSSNSSYSLYSKASPLNKIKILAKFLCSFVFLFLIVWCVLINCLFFIVCHLLS